LGVQLVILVFSFAGNGESRKSYPFSQTLCHLLLLFSGPLFVVVEYAALGNLRQFLQERRPGLEYHDEVNVQSPKQLIVQDLLSFCYQVAKGMEFLSSRKVNN